MSCIFCPGDESTIRQDIVIEHPSAGIDAELDREEFPVAKSARAAPQLEDIVEQEAKALPAIRQVQPEGAMAKVAPSAAPVLSAAAVSSLQPSPGPAQVPVGKPQLDQQDLEKQKSRAKDADARSPTDKTGTTAEPATRCGRFLDSILQQPEATNLFPLWFYRAPCMMVTMIIISGVLFVIGGILITQAAKVAEVKVGYKHTDTILTFTLAKDIPGPVLVQYELPQVNMNNKRFVENQDKRIVNSILNNPTCADAADVQSVTWRRQDPEFTNLLINNSLAPCGLVSMSMFLDEYQFFQSDGSSPPKWKLLTANENNIYLPMDAGNYEKQLTVNATSGQVYVNGELSWLKSGTFLNHWKVWQRVPASPHIRNLWATIDGGMTAGDYMVNVTKNSPSWTTVWGVPEKRLILCGSHSLGSPGAMQYLGGICLAGGVLEVVMFLSFGAMLGTSQQQKPS